MSQIKKYMDFLEFAYGPTVEIGGIVYDLRDTDNWDKLYKVLRSFPDLVPPAFTKKRSWKDGEGKVDYESDIESQNSEKGYF